MKLRSWLAAALLLTARSLYRILNRPKATKRNTSDMFKKTSSTLFGVLLVFINL